MNKPYMTKRHLVLEILSYVLLLVCFIIAIVGMATLPDEIPTHFTMSGEIDGYGSPGTLLILPIIMLICNGMTSLIMHVMPPTMWNTPSKLKPQNAVRALQDMISMIAWMELEISAFTLFSTISIYRGKDAGWASIILFVGALTVTIVYYIVAFQKHNNM